MELFLKKEGTRDLQKSNRGRIRVIREQFTRLETEREGERTDVHPEEEKRRNVHYTETKKS